MINLRRVAGCGLAAGLLASLTVVAQCVDPTNSDVFQYDVVNDGTRVRSAGGSLGDNQNTSFADDGDRGAYYVGNTIDGLKVSTQTDYWYDTTSSGIITFKFPATRVVNRMVLDNHILASHAHSENYVIEYSSDTSDGIDGIWGPVPAAAASGTIIADEVIDVPFTTPIAVRYIRIRITASTTAWVTMNEVEFFAGDNLGDACDACPFEAGNLPNGCPEFDSDNDGIIDTLDNCPLVQNAAQTNSDGDSLGDACDNCPTFDNEDQANTDLFQYDLTTDGTLISSNKGSLNDDFDTRYVDGSPSPKSSDGYWPGNIIDGFTIGEVQADTANYWMKQANNVNLTLKFPGVRVISKIVLDNDTRTAHWNTQAYDVQSSLDTTDGSDGTWTTVSSPTATGIMNGDDVIEVVLDQAIARHHIRVVLTKLSGTYASLNEIQVFGGDWVGDACDDCDAVGGEQLDGCPGPLDYDADGVPDTSDNCVFAANAGQTNSDTDNLGDACDNCPLADNPTQANSDVVAYDLTNNGTLIASSVGMFFEPGNTGFVDSSPGANPNYHLGNLLDGQTGSSFEDYWLTDVAVPSAVLTLDFLAPQIVYKVVLTHNTAIGHWMTAEYTLEYSTDSTTGFDGTWQSVPGPDATGYVFWQDQTTITLPTPISTRFMRLQYAKVDGAGVRTALNEIQVFSGDPLPDACDACPLEAATDPSGCNNQPPTAACQDISVELDAAGAAAIVAGDVNNNSTDPDGDTLSLSIDVDSFTCAELGANTVTLTVDDSNGGIDTCEATVTVTNAGTCVDLQNAAITAICSQGATNLKELIAAIDAAIDTFLGESTICDSTVADCRAALLALLNVPQ